MVIGSQATTGLFTEDNDYYQQFGTFAKPGSFNGTAGIGQGSVTPTTAGAYPGAPNCTAGPGGNTPGVGWWNTSNNTLYVCTATNTWTVYYTPFVYPHPLQSGTGGGPTPPNPPSGLSASASGSTVNLSWTASAGSPVPTGYTLYRGTVSGGPYTLVKTALTTTSTTDTPGNGTFFYVVTGFVGGLVTNIIGNGTTATVTCSVACTFPANNSFISAGNSIAAFNGTFTVLSQPTSTTFTFSIVGGTNAIKENGCHPCHIR